MTDRSVLRENVKWVHVCLYIYRHMLLPYPYVFYGLSGWRHPYFTVCAQNCTFFWFVAFHLPTLSAVIAGQSDIGTCTYICTYVHMCICPKAAPPSTGLFACDHSDVMSQMYTRVNGTNCCWLPAGHSKVA